LFICGDLLGLLIFVIELTTISIFQVLSCALSLTFLSFILTSHHHWGCFGELSIFLFFNFNFLLYLLSLFCRTSILFTFFTISFYFKNFINYLKTSKTCPNVRGNRSLSYYPKIYLKLKEGHQMINFCLWKVDQRWPFFISNPNMIMLINLRVIKNSSLIMKTIRLA